MAQKKRRNNRKRHHWTNRETKIYLNYLQNHQELFVDYSARKRNKVFLSIARLLKTRKSQQVKSHHQKLMKKCGSFPNLISFLREIQEVFDDSPSTHLDEDSNSILEPQSSNDIWQTEPLDLSLSEEIRNSIYESGSGTESHKRTQKNE